MGFTADTVDVGDGEAVALCSVTPDGVKVRNLGDVTVFVGGPDVAGDDARGGYPIDPGKDDTFTAPKPKESPVVPAPEGDLDSPVLYARTANGTGPVRVAWITAG